MGFFFKTPKVVSWGQNAKNGLILSKMAIGSHFRGPISNVMAKKSTETNFKYKNGAKCLFSLNNPTNVSCGQIAKNGLILVKNCSSFKIKGPNVECHG